MLELNNISMGYSEDILQQATFTFQPGKLYFLLARNGAGKSSLFRMIAQELKPRAGNIVVNGRVTLHRQSPVYFEDMTVKENMECFLELLNTKASYVALKQRYHLGEIENKVARKLSGGEKQRLYLAITGMSDDEIQLYDEADAALDAITRKLYYTEVLKRNASEGKLVVAISHHISESLRLADRICFLSNKRLFEINPHYLPSELLDMNEDRILEYLEKEGSKHEEAIV